MVHYEHSFVKLFTITSVQLVAIFRNIVMHCRTGRDSQVSSQTHASDSRAQTYRENISGSVIFSVGLDLMSSTWTRAQTVYRVLSRVLSYSTTRTKFKPFHVDFRWDRTTIIVFDRQRREFADAAENVSRDEGENECRARHTAPA